MIRLFDSLQRKKVDFVPLQPGRVGIYLCGPTVYDRAHIGHARSALAFDIVRRHFLYRNFQVTYVRNITDVDDKIIHRANERGVTTQTLTEHYTAEYRRDMGALAILPPDVEPRVTDHIPGVIEIVSRLIKNGLAYEVEGDVYYRVSKFAPYGKLAGQGPEELLAGARVEVDTRKENPLDFA